jgi:hypothetical protein
MDISPGLREVMNWASSTTAHRGRGAVADGPDQVAGPGEGLHKRDYVLIFAQRSGC